MPSVKLDFLKNVTQRLATGRSMPLRQVEAIVKYGTAAQRAKVVEKLLPSTYNLSLNKKTHHVLITLIDNCDNLVRVNLLYQIRRKIVDVAMSPVGNEVLQHLIEKLPARQRKEVAEAFVLNRSDDEFLNLCRHPYGNHVAQKLMEYPEAAEIVAPTIQEHLLDLIAHELGSRVVARYVEKSDGGLRALFAALLPDVPDDVEEEERWLEEGVAEAVDEAVELLIRTHKQTFVLSAVMRHPLVPAAFKDAICAHVCEYARDYLDPQPKEAAKTTATKGGSAGEEDDGDFAMPDFGNASTAGAKVGGKHDTIKQNLHVFASVFEHGDDVHRSELWEAIAACGFPVTDIVSQRSVSQVAIAAVRFCPASRAAIHKALFTGVNGAAEVATDAVRTTVLRAIIDVAPDMVTARQRKELVSAADTLARSPTGSPVLQKLLESAPGTAIAADIFAAIRPSIAELVKDGSGCFLLQSLIEHGGEELRAAVIADINAAYPDLHDILSYAQGSRVMQKVVMYGSDECVKDIVSRLVDTADEAAAANEEEAAAEEDEEDADNEEEEDEEENEEDEEETADDSKKDSAPAANAGGVVKKKTAKQLLEEKRKMHYAVTSRAVVSYALHSQACYFVQALLRATRDRGLQAERRSLMGHLKPFVFDLAVSPWAGSIVLDAMAQVASEELRQAMHNVVFLKAEEWLSIGAEGRKNIRPASLDTTTREMLKRQREGDDTEASLTSKAARTEENDVPVQPKNKSRHRNKKVFRSLKR